MEKEKRERKERKRKSAVFRHSDVSRWRLGIHQRQPVVKSYRARDELLAIAVVTAHGNHSDRKKQNQATKPNKIKLYSKCFLKWPDNKQPKTRTQTSPIIYLFIVLFLNCRNKVSTPFPLHFQLFALSDLKIVSAPGVSRWGGGGVRPAKRWQHWAAPVVLCVSSSAEHFHTEVRDFSLRLEALFYDGKHAIAECSRRCWGHVPPLLTQKRKDRKWNKKQQRHDRIPSTIQRQVILLFCVRSVSTVMALSADLICSRIPGLTARQRRMCSTRPDAMVAISSGAKLGLTECQEQFKHHRWNCTAVGAHNGFGHVVVVGRSPLTWRPCRDPAPISKNKKIILNISQILNWFMDRC